MKQYSQACEENREPILSVLRETFRSATDILEVGSGTGQHAVYFAAELPHLTWNTSDLSENHAGIRAWVDEAGLDNVCYPIELDVTRDHWPDRQYDGLFSANTTHIMSWPAVEAFFAGVAGVLQTDSSFCLYGPFNYNGDYTSDSNARFDQWLRQRDPASGIRDVDALKQLAESGGLAFREDYEMPVNNRLLVWTKTRSRPSVIETRN